MRLVAASLSCLTLWVVYLLGQTYFDWKTGCLAAFFLAVSPVAIQQAHFYTVDGLFTLFVLLGLFSGFRAADAPTRWRYLLAGVVVGLAAAIRLSGLLLGLPLLLAHLTARSASQGSPNIRPQSERYVRRLLDGDLWIAAAAALAVLLMLQPFLVLSPELMLRSATTDDFALSAKIATGEVLRLWSLADLHTVPYLHHWTMLWPQASGWSFTVAALLAIPLALWRRHRHGSLLLVWASLYFAFVGGLHTKHVRCLLPMLPLLAIVVGKLTRLPWSMAPSLQRLVARLAVILLAGYSCAYGVAFAGLYTEEDSRIRAGRWIDQNVPEGSAIGVERGGFSMGRILDGKRYRTPHLGMSIPFGSRGYLSCQATARFLQRTLGDMEYVAIVDVNRYRQYTAVPEMFPAVADFYRALLQGELGFEPVGQFQVLPSLLGVSFGLEEPEVSFTAYDHPTVTVLKKGDRFAEAWAVWEQRLVGSAGCHDQEAGILAEALRGSKSENRFPGSK